MQFVQATFDSSLIRILGDQRVGPKVDSTYLAHLAVSLLKRNGEVTTPLKPFCFEFKEGRLLVHGYTNIPVEHLNSRVTRDYLVEPIRESPTPVIEDHKVLDFGVVCCLLVNTPSRFRTGGSRSRSIIHLARNSPGSDPNLEDESIVEDWVTRRLMVRGARLLDATVSLSSLRVTRKDHRSEVYREFPTLPIASIHGSLEVTSAERFLKNQGRPIGSQDTFGLGLLQVFDQ